MQEAKRIVPLDRGNKEGQLDMERILDLAIFGAEFKLSTTVDIVASFIKIQVKGDYKYISKEAVDYNIAVHTEAKEILEYEIRTLKAMLDLHLSKQNNE